MSRMTLSLLLEGYISSRVSDVVFQTKKEIRNWWNRAMPALRKDDRQDMGSWRVVYWNSMQKDKPNDKFSTIVMHERTVWVEEGGLYALCSTIRSRATLSNAPSLRLNAIHAGHLLKYKNNTTPIHTNHHSIRTLQQGHTQYRVQMTLQQLLLLQ